MDPEVYSESDYGFNGVDMGSYPVPRTFTFGMKLNFNLLTIHGYENNI